MTHIPRISGDLSAQSPNHNLIQQYIRHRPHWSRGHILDSYSGGAQFESRAEQRLFLLRIFMAVLGFQANSLNSVSKNYIWILVQDLRISYAYDVTGKWTKSMDLSLSGEAASRVATQEFPNIYEPQGSVLC
jgi:hypothetical protein